MLALLPAAGGGQRKKLADAARIWARREFENEEEHDQREADAQAHLEAQFAAHGIVPDEPLDERAPLEAFYLFPENLPAWLLFMSVQTQWRGTVEREGLDYDGVYRVIDQQRQWRKRRRQLFDHLQIMERAALEEWRRQPPPGSAR